MITITTLGTASGKPTPERNVSCTAVFREGDLILFDCGEGTQIQMARSTLRPGTVRIVCITHFHGDHINGLPGMLGSFQLNQRTEPLVLIGPEGLERYITTLRRLGVLGVQYPLNLLEVSQPGVVYTTPDFSISADKLKHRIPCWGYRLEEPTRSGRFDVEAARALAIPPGPMYGQLQRGKAVTLDDGRVIEPSQVVGPSRPGLVIAYCCDTQPCEGAVRLGAGADVLIHEGTYAPGEEALAHPRGHSTMSDAARCAQAAQAHRLIITHVSPRYTRTGGFEKAVQEIFPHTSIAQDLDSFEVQHRE
jgi:ribonuclease Z